MTLFDWIAQAKRPETRAARIAQIAARGERANTWPRVAGAKRRD
jgi:uncharacterized protein YdeI (YjbR/CyaY-like superfamily)